MKNHRLTRGIAIATASALLMAATAAGAVDLRSWDVKINDATKRFIVLPAFKNQAVLDKETQLVWQRAPSNEFISFEDARTVCQRAALGGRRGWRVPALSELRSLLDANVSDFHVTALPAGHPFIGIMEPFGNGPTGNNYGRYWTSTLNTTQDANYRLVVTMDGVVNPTVLPIGTALGAAWCVRGAMSSGE
jgi:Protein of unknown function (DUF1566)